MPTSLGRIRHVVALMLENRSFDHMLGFLKDDMPSLTGLTGAESNPIDPADAASPRIRVSRDASYLGDFTRELKPGKRAEIDPGHGLKDVGVQLYAPVAPNWGVDPRNEGFIASYAGQKNSNRAHGANVMRCFDPARLPVLATLAKEFAVCDHWYSSVPGPTWPNRLFVHTASSDGLVVHKPKLYGMRTVYDLLKAKDLTARIYAGDIAQSLLLRRLLFSGIFHNMDAFWSDVRTGKLPSYSFIEPDYFGGDANDQHPPHDVAAGEHLIADVYEALRRSRYWNECLLVVLYDEHGGLYDQVSPPRCAPPDGKVSTKPPFAFDRMGVRVPAVVVSPYVIRSTIDSGRYDHTSLIAILRKCFSLPEPLTRRDAEATTFENLLALPEPRTDTPEKLPRPPRARRARVEPRPLSDLQRQLLELADMVSALHRASGVPPTRAVVSRAAALKNEDIAKQYAAAVYEEQARVSRALETGGTRGRRRQ